MELSVSKLLVILFIRNAVSYEYDYNINGIVLNVGKQFRDLEVIITPTLSP